ncbi:hypothetical protein K503DRAFT_868977 [Rhizopogon vinicolor AM-OR11-026]|uniref:Uncharacterized protein n=1 Tax=Rhizopogon vinicolor AM-OR11-026 TaxID=1314800 RepID=A0A1B7MP08_9AGAM|nr:hypothetical protein K503DRAFT_868977 [Rhizopogon vinicolor AM-OR11-026]
MHPSRPPMPNSCHQTLTPSAHHPEEELIQKCRNECQICGVGLVCEDEACWSGIGCHSQVCPRDIVQTWRDACQLCRAVYEYDDNSERSEINRAGYQGYHADTGNRDAILPRLQSPMLNKEPDRLTAMSPRHGNYAPESVEITAPIGMNTEWPLRTTLMDDGFCASVRCSDCNKQIPLDKKLSLFPGPMLRMHQRACLKYLEKVPKIIRNITSREASVGEPSRERGEKTGSGGFSPGGGTVNRWSASSGSQRHMNSTTGASQSLAQLQARIPLFWNTRQHQETYYPESYLRHSGRAALSGQSCH